MKPHTPQWWLYVVAVAISLQVHALEWAIATRSPMTFVLVMYFGAIPALVLGLVEVPVVHLACRHQPRQWVHVLAAGLAGIAPGVVIGLVSRLQGTEVEESLLLWTLGLGLSTAIGRAAVVPMVRRESADFSRTTSSG